MNLLLRCKTLKNLHEEWGASALQSQALQQKQGYMTTA